MQIKSFILTSILISSIQLAGLTQNIKIYDFSELSVGYGIGFTQYIYSGQIAFEIKPTRLKASSYNFEYHFDKGVGGSTINNPNSISTSSFIATQKEWFVNRFWRPFSFGNQRNSLMILGIGVGYSKLKFADYLMSHGPAIQGTAGFQYVFIDRISLTIKTQLYYMYNLDMEDLARIKFDGMPIRINIGYRFK